MLNVKRRCQPNSSKNEEFFWTNGNMNGKHEINGNDQKFCLQHNNFDCSTPEVRNALL